MKNAECRKAGQSRLKPHQSRDQAKAESRKQKSERQGNAAQSHASANVEGRMMNAEKAAAAQPLRAIPVERSTVGCRSKRRLAG
jgi:hypothetical protein